MLNHNPFYHGIIKKVITAFGAIFSDISIERRSGDSVSGTLAQTLKIPLSYGPKEKWLVRLEQDPNLENNTYTSVPRIAFEITGYSYDAQRKTNRTQNIQCNSGVNTGTSIQTLVPWNIDIAVNILTKTQEDGLQILEQILPFFPPEYTLSINAVPSMNLIQDVPVILNSVSVMDEYDGAFTERRFVTHTLDFTLKVNLFGPQSTKKIITTSMADISQTITFDPNVANYTATGNPSTGSITDTWLEHF